MPWHAPLISEELKTINGVKSIRYRFPNKFEVRYDPAITSREEILSLDVFDTYRAVVIEEPTNDNRLAAPSGSCSRGCSGGGCSAAGGCRGGCACG